MIELTPEMTVIVMTVGLLVGILLGYPLIFSLAGVALVVGFITLGPQTLGIFYLRLWGILKEYTLLAIPLFVFMGTMVQQSGVADRLFHALHIWMGGLRGGLAIATVLTGTLLAAGVGVVTASVVVMGLIALPAMLNRGYSKEIATGAVCSGGTLGILIPPSIMIVVYGPAATLSVGKLFMAAFIPGLVLSALYIIYLVMHCAINPSLGPALPKSERIVPFKTRLRMLVVSIVPPVVLIFSVLGSIFAGIAAPTEAAAVGALVSVLMALGYRSLNWKMLVLTLHETLAVTGMVYGVAIGASMFTGIFLSLGGGDVVTDLVLGAPFGKWGIFIIIMLIIFVLGMFIDWMGIILVMVPLVTPIGKALGFDPVWFAMMIIVNLQMSFMSPPFCPTVFVLRGIIPSEWGISTNMIIKGVLPYIPLIIIALGLFIAFPELILWLPEQMIK